ncbi:MAG: ABC transporter permease, partial [Firmicutes bacterium]|nr:ABC transporter permease [Bacillota bacterium]
MISQELGPENLQPVKIPKEPRTRSREWRAFWKNPLARVGVAGLIFLVLFSFVGPVVYTASAYTPHLTAILQGPSGKFPLGTDSLGRNELARLMLGGQLSLEVGFAAAFMATLIGLIYGLTSGYLGGWVDVVMMRFVDIMIAIP